MCNTRVGPGVLQLRGLCNSMRSGCALKLSAVHFSTFTKHTDVMSAVCTRTVHAEAELAHSVCKHLSSSSLTTTCALCKLMTYFCFVAILAKLSASACCKTCRCVHVRVTATLCTIRYTTSAHAACCLIRLEREA